MYEPLKARNAEQVEGVELMLTLHVAKKKKIIKNRKIIQSFFGAQQFFFSSKNQK